MKSHARSSSRPTTWTVSTATSFTPGPAPASQARLAALADWAIICDDIICSSEVGPSRPRTRSRSSVILARTDSASRCCTGRRSRRQLRRLRRTGRDAGAVQDDHWRRQRSHDQARGMAGDRIQLTAGEPRPAQHAQADAVGPGGTRSPPRKLTVPGQSPYRVRLPRTRSVATRHAVTITAGDHVCVELGLRGRNLVEAGAAQIHRRHYRTSVGSAPSCTRVAHSA